MVTNKLTGQVGILPNLGDGSSPPPSPIAPGPDCPAVDPTHARGHQPGGDGRRRRRPLTPGGPTDLVTINPGSNTLGVLAGLAEAGSPTP